MVSAFVTTTIVRDDPVIPMNTLVLDVRHALRALRKHPAFTAVAVFTLALAIAATTTVFAVVDAVIIRPLPFTNPDRLVQIWEKTPEGADFSSSEPNYLDFARQNRTLAGLAAFKPAEVALTGVGDPLRLRAVAASQSLFPLLGVRPIVGRGFTAEEDAARQPSNAVILSHKLWMSRFAGDSSVVGRTIALNGQAHRVVGVMPATLRFPVADAFLPLHADASSQRGDHWLQLVGRMRPASTIDDVATDFANIAAQLGAAYPESKGWSTRVESLSSSLVDESFRRAGWVLLAATGLLLLLACANVANLLLARASGRQAEMGVRAAIGAGRTRLVRLWLTESAILVGIAATIGITGTVWAQSAIQAVGAGRIPRLEEVTIDARVLGIALLLSVLTTLACGLVPALRASSIDPAAVLGDAGRGSASRHHRRVRDVLVVWQIAVSMVLLVGAGLMLRSFNELSTVDAGFDADHVLAVTLNLPPQRYNEEGRAVFYARLTSRLRGLPGVRAAGATVVDPFTGWNLMNDVTPEDRAATTSVAGFMQAAWRSITPDFFDAMGIVVQRGRVFSREDAWNGPRIAVISRSLADKLWPNQDPISKRMFWGGTDGTPLTVIGVVDDVRDVAPQTAPLPTLYLSYNQLPMPGMTVVIRATGEPSALVGPLREIIRGLDPILPVDDIHPLSRNRVDAMTAPRFNLWLMAGFATLALLVAASGIYAVIAFNVVQRRREIGIRLAIGAEPAGVVGFFLGSGLRLIAAGIAGGLIIAWLASRFMKGILFGIEPTDAMTFAVVPVVLAVVAIVSTYIPARRAARVVPTEALRGE